MPITRCTASLSRRRILQTGSAAAILALAGGAPALARQGAGAGYTFIVAGLDFREGFETHNSDVLMIARVDTGTGSVNAVSIPRDLYIEIPGYGADKITSAFTYGYEAASGDWDGGAALLAETITQSFGVAIDGVVTTTFAGFVEMIDALGGVTVDNPYAVDDPKAVEWGEVGLWTWPAGVQTLDGASALRFVRSRGMDGDDGRVMRQQLVLRAVLDQLQQPEMVTKVPALVDALRDAVETNIPAEVQASLIAALPSVDPARVAFTNIADQLWGGTLDSGMWVYQGDWSTLPGHVQALLAA